MNRYAEFKIVDIEGEWMSDSLHGGEVINKVAVVNREPRTKEEFKALEDAGCGLSYKCQSYQGGQNYSETQIQKLMNEHQYDYDSFIKDVKKQGLDVSQAQSFYNQSVSKAGNHTIGGIIPDTVSNKMFGTLGMFRWGVTFVLIGICIWLLFWVLPAMMKFDECRIAEHCVKLLGVYLWW